MNRTRVGGSIGTVAGIAGLVSAGAASDGRSLPDASLAERVGFFEAHAPCGTTHASRTAMRIDRREDVGLTPSFYRNVAAADTFDRDDPPGARDRDAATAAAPASPA